MSYIINAEKFYQNRMPGVGQPYWVSDGPVGIPDFDQRLCTWLMSLSRSSECSLTTHVLIIHMGPSWEGKAVSASSFLPFLLVDPHLFRRDPGFGRSQDFSRRLNGAVWSCWRRLPRLREVLAIFAWMCLPWNLYYIWDFWFPLPHPRRGRFRKVTAVTVAFRRLSAFQLCPGRFCSLLQRPGLRGPFARGGGCSARRGTRSP